MYVLNNFKDSFLVEGKFFYNVQLSVVHVKFNSLLDNFFSVCIRKAEKLPDVIIELNYQTFFF